MEVSREVVTFIIGVSGLVLHHLRIMRWQLVLSIVSLAHRVYPFGRRFNNLLQNKADLMQQSNFCLMKDMGLSSTREENTCKCLRNNQRALNYKHIKVD